MERVTEPLAYTVAELQEALGVGRQTAYRLASELGIRVSPRRIVVPRVRVQEFLSSHDAKRQPNEQ